MAATYCTVQDVRDGALKFLTIEAIGDKQVNVFISEAQAAIDGKLVRRYSVPFTDTIAYPAGVPLLIKKIARLLATADSVEDVMTKDFNSDEVKGIGRFRKRANDELVQLRDGKIEIPGATQKPQLSGALPRLHLHRLMPRVPTRGGFEGLDPDFGREGWDGCDDD